MYFLYFLKIFCCSSADIPLDEESEYAGEYSSDLTKLKRIFHEGWSLRFQKSVSESIVSLGTLVGVSFLFSGTWKTAVVAGDEWLEKGLLAFGPTLLAEVFATATSSKMFRFADLSESFRFIFLAFAAALLFKMLAIVLVVLTVFL